MSPEAPTPPGVDRVAEMIGLEYVDHDGDVVRGRVPVSDRILQAFGLVHGGVHSMIAETLCSAATWLAVRDQGMMAMGQSNSATFLRPISEGHVNATARVRHRGRTTWIWDVDFTDDDERLCAIVRMTVAVRPFEG
jgi:1,4-dihydroxy-2-naphthoyl-CoA hydrolase